jgi:asparagine synthase (glutamine-hydrolysing)
MLDRIAHRGPDDSGHCTAGDRAWLGHVRLSIVDVGGGHQPLGDTGVPGGPAHDGWALVCNGEIYNHADLRADLGPAAFTTASDNEAALALLRRHGPAGLERLTGMWALCAAHADGGFVAARDRLGIKPLYWARDGGAAYFASELRAFDEAVQPLVEIFPPGCYWTPEDGVVRFAAAVPEPDAAADWSGTPARVAEKATREVVIASVHRHMMADVPVGVFLSGGLDSSLVAAIASAHLARTPGAPRLLTFAVGTAGSPDLLAAREVAAYLGTDHHEAVFDGGQATAALDEVVAAVESFDASLIRSAVPNWFLSELAARHVKTVLTGEGADELFAGYGYYHAAHGAPAELDRELARSIGALHGLNLQRCDRVTMAHGLEARVPFLDAEVIAHAMSLPPELKALDAGGVEKAHLRRAFDGWLPDHLLWRRKVQFGTGSGARDVLTPHWDGLIGDAEFARERAGVRTELRTKEELAYYRVFRTALPSVRPEAVLTRFSTA